MIEKVRSESMLGYSRAMAASREFEHCLEMLIKGQVYHDHHHKPISIPALLPPVEIDLNNPRPALNYRRWQPKQQEAFCEALAQCGNVDQACRYAGRGRTAAYALRNRAEGKAFALAWDAALLVYTHEMIDMTMELAREGGQDEIARKGKVTRWKKKECSDVALQVLGRLEALKAREDALYGDGYDRIGAAKDFGAALDRLESGEAIKAIEGTKLGKHPVRFSKKRRR
jgi:hypothetical protein